MYIHKNIFQHFLAWAQLCLNPRVLFQFLNDSRLGKNLGAEGDWKIANPRANRHAHSSTRIAFFVENGSHQWLLHESAIYICMRPASFQIQKYEGAFFMKNVCILHGNMLIWHVVCYLTTVPLGHNGAVEAGAQHGRTIFDDHFSQIGNDLTLSYNKNFSIFDVEPFTNMYVRPRQTNS